MSEHAPPAGQREHNADGSRTPDDGPIVSPVGRLTAPNQTTAGGAERRSGYILVGGFVGLVAATIAYFALGMPGMDHSPTTSMDDMVMNESTDQSPARRVDADQFEEVVGLPETVVLNVHVPAAGEIEGTDLFMAFDDIDPALLPSDRNTPVAVYCKSGSMSAIAVARLAQAGYTDIVELEGGMGAWVASGRSLIART